MSNCIELLWGNMEKMKIGQQMKEHRHTCFQLYYIVSGNPEYIVSGSLLHTQAGAYFVVPEMAPHSMLTLTDSDLTCYEFKFLINDPALAQRFQALRPPMTDTGVVRKLLRYVSKNWNSTADEIKADIECILTTILMSFFVDELRYTERDSRFVTTHTYNKTTKDILIYAEKHYPHEFSLDHLAAALNYNKNYLSSVFKKNTGYTIIDYVNMLRIRHSVIIFVYYGQDVYSTCECVGFHDISYFSRMFKSLTGVSPRAFKKALAASDPKNGDKHHLLDPITDFQLCPMDMTFQALRNIEAFCN